METEVEIGRERKRHLQHDLESAVKSVHFLTRGTHVQCAFVLLCYRTLLVR